jgi:hypothetical protein
MQKRQLIIITIVLIATGLLLTMTSFRQEAQDKFKSQQNEEPIAEINTSDTSDPKEKEIRTKRGRKYKTRVSLDKMDDQPAVFEIPLSHSLAEPAFPVEQSDIIVIGTIEDSHAFVSNDKTAVYSEFQVNINEILKNDKTSRIDSSLDITAERVGGRVRFPLGRIQTRGESGRNLPQKNKQYVLFLKWDEEGKDYLIITGYQIDGQSINPLDGLPDANPRIYSEYSLYKNADLAEFLTKLQRAIENSSAGGN